MPDNELFEQSTGRTRRTLLRTAAGLGVLTVASVPSVAPAAAQDSLEIEYSGGGWGATSAADDNIMTNVNIEIELSNEITLGPNEDLGVRITNTDTDATLRCTATERFTISADDRLELSNLHNRDGTIRDDPEFQLNTSDDIEFYPAAVEGDRDIFTTGPIFSTYTIEIIESLDDPTTVATTEAAPRAIGLERPPIEQEGSAGEIDLRLELPEALDPSWTVEFSPFISDDDFTFVPTDIPNPGTETLEWSADFSGSAPGSYDGWRVAVYPDNNTRSSDVIWSTTGFSFNDADFITISDDEDDGGDDPQPPEEWTEQGLTDDQFNAVADDGELTRPAMRDATQAWIEDGNVEGTVFTRAELRSAIEVFINS